MTRIPRWALVTLAVLMTVIAFSHDEAGWWVWAGALLTPVVAVTLLAAYPVGSLAVCVTASVAVALAVGESVPVWTVALGAALGVVSLLAGRRMSRSTPALVLFGVGAVLGIVTWGAGLLLLGLTVVFPWVVGRSLRQQAELVATIGERTRLQERTRIAHDMHDTLGHELSLQALRAGMLEITLEGRHQGAAAELRAGAEQATERLAEIIGVLRDGDPAPVRPVTERIDDLVARATEAGMPVSLTWDDPRELPAMVDRAAYRIVQEALTNATKHAPGQTIHVRLATVDATTTVTVTNALPIGGRRGSGGGSGLVGLRERARLVGGTLHAGPRGHTFEIVATLPHMGES